MPLGVLSISSYIKQHADVEVKLLDFNVVLNKIQEFKSDSFGSLFYDVLSDWINYSPTVIGISTLFTSAYDNTLQLGQTCRKLFPLAIITAGGGVPTNLYREIFSSCKSFDALCFGEGELPFLDLLKAQDKKQSLMSNPAWITREKSQTNATFLPAFIENLDEIPFCDYDICNPDDYSLNPAITAYAGGANEKLQNFHVMTSRGCTHRCCFCSSHTVHGRSMRYFSLSRVEEDLRCLRDRYGAKTIVFQDDHFMADKRRAKQVIQFVRALKMNTVFQNGLALYALDRDMLELLKDAGVNQLLLSVESGSERVLRHIMHKPLDLSIVKRVANDCRELGIYTNTNILIGLPGETKKDIEDAIAFLKTIPCNWYMIFCATPLVGSEMYEICKQKGYLNDNHIGADYKHACISTEDFTATEIQQSAYDMNIELNFVNNWDFKLGHYEAALKGFENVIRAKDDHAIAYFYAARCLEKTGDLDKAHQYMQTAQREGATPFWKKYFDRFGLFDENCLTT